jgi:chemotaxis response regulator CheB
MIRVLVVEDSPTARALLVHLLEEDPEIQVVGQATDGRQGVEMATRLRSDFILMDVVMPNMDGLEATRHIMGQRPTPILIVTAYADSPELNVAFEAIKAGALDVVAKPAAFGEEESDDWGRELVSKVKALVDVRPWSEGRPAIRVLVVEDSPTARALLVCLLEDDPEIQVVGQATDGHQAVEMAAQLQPDLITMDAVMPDMDGLEAIRRIMAQRPTPILIVTAHADSPELNVVFEAMKAGALDVVTKPTGFDELKNSGWEHELVAKVKALAGVHPRPVAEMR